MLVSRLRSATSRAEEAWRILKGTQETITGIIETMCAHLCLLYTAITPAMNQMSHITHQYCAFNNNH